MSRGITTLLLLALLSAETAAQQTVTLPARDRGLSAETPPVFIVGKAEGAEWETFSGVLGVGFDGKDNLYVLDTQNHRVVVFDRGGRFVRQFGKRGGGPGEFQLPFGIAVTSQGVIVIADVGKQAFLAFNGDGTFVRSVSFPEGQMFSPQMRIRADRRSGIIVARQQSADLGAMEKSAMSGQRVTWNPAMHIHTVSLTADANRTVLFVQPPRTETQPIDVGVSDMSIRMALPALVHFAPGLHWDVLSDGGIAVANDASYRVQIISGTGEVTRVLTRPIEPRKVTKADRDRVLELQRSHQIGALTQLPPEVRAMTENLRKQMQTNVQFADVHAVIGGIATDATGRLFVSRGEGLVDIVAADGRYVGTVHGLGLPMAFSASGRYAQIEVDGDGVEKIVVRQVPSDWLK